MDVDTLEAGRELDALVAERVMGLRMVSHKTATYDPTPDDAPIGRFADVPRYSTDVAAAWGVVERVLKLGHYFKIAPHCFYKPPAWIIQLDVLGDVLAETFPLAICRAALKAVAR